MRFFFACALLLALPQAAAADTLLQVWQEARASDPAYAAADAQLRAARAAAPAALAALLPHLTVAAGAGPQKDHIAGPEFDGIGFEPVSQTEKIGVSTWTASLTQSLFDWTAVQTHTAADFAVQAAAATYQASLEQLNVQVATDYVAVLGAAADVACLQTAAGFFAAQYQDAQARYRAGLSGIIGAQEALAAAHAIDAQSLQSQQTLIAAQQTLAGLTGDETVQASGTLPDHVALPFHNSLADWLAQAQTGNPALAADQLTVDDDGALVSAAQGGYLPSVTLQLQHMQTDQGGSQGFSEFGLSGSGPGNQVQADNSVTVQMSWNVFDGGATHAEADRAAATRDQAVADEATARLAVITAIHTNDIALALDEARLQAARAAAAAAASAVHAAADGVRAGLVSEDDLIADRQQLLSAQLNLHEAAVASIGHELALAQAAGSATPALISTLSAILAQPLGKDPNHE
jgi:outer membrane protein